MTMTIAQKKYDMLKLLFDDYTANGYRNFAKGRQLKDLAADQLGADIVAKWMSAVPADSGFLATAQIADPSQPADARPQRQVSVYVLSLTGISFFESIDPARLPPTL